MDDGRDGLSRLRQANRNVTTVEVWATGRANVRVCDQEDLLTQNLDALLHVVVRTVASGVEAQERRGRKIKSNKPERAAITAAFEAITSEFANPAYEMLDCLSPTRLLPSEKDEATPSMKLMLTRRPKDFRRL